MKHQKVLTSLLFLVLMLVGTTLAWAAKNTTYRIVNNKGEVCLLVKGTTDKPELPSRARTPYATNYRYYLTLQEAQRDARYGAELAASTYGAQPLNTNVNLSGDGDVFVRYDYTSASTITDAEGNVVRIDGKTAYNLQVNDRLVYYSTATSPQFTTPKSSNGSTIGPVEPSADEPIRVTHSLTKIYNGTDDDATNNLTDAIKNSGPYKWIYDGTQSATNNYEASLGHPDPYDLRLINLSDRTKVLTGIQNNSFPFTPSVQQYIHLTLAADGASTTYVQRFFIRKINAVIQVAACEPMYVYYPSSGNNTTTQWFVLNKEKDEPQYMGNFSNENYHVASLHLRIHEKQDATGITASSSANRSTCTFHALKNRKYTIVGSDGTTRASAYAPVSDTETLEVPSEINSPLVSSYTYHKSANEAMNHSNPVSTISGFDAGEDVFVGYSYNSSNNILNLNDASARYTMQLNDNYLKYQEGAGDDSDVTVGTEDESENAEYRWSFTGSDPYGILVTNEAASSKNITGVSTSGTITLGTDSKAAALQGNTSASSHTPYRYYLVKSPNWTAENPLYILRAASVGNEDLRYNWAYVGDESDWNESQPRLAASNWLDDDNDAVQLQLDKLRTTTLTYHVIDLQGKIVAEASTLREVLKLPDAISSPLVDTYHYYQETDFEVNDGVYTFNDTPTELTSTTGLNDIYVVYDTEDLNSSVDISAVVDETAEGTTHGQHNSETTSRKTSYMLQYYNGESFNQEDGANGIEETAMKAIYPYTNGDAGFNIYGDERRTAHFGKAANERKRYTWYIDSPTGDPYHVKIVAANNTSHSKKVNNVIVDNFYNSFRTYYNTTLQKVITSPISNDPQILDHAQFGDPTAVATDYMLLGKTGKYRLVTSEKINGEQQTVTNYEQYWKNYETIGQLFGVYNTETKVVEEMPADAELTAKGWHKYAAWHNAKPLDGSAKVFEYQNHWYQTIELGAEFDLIPISLKPALVLVDKHGWEVFRHTMPDASNHNKNDGTDNNSDDNIIRTYNSPAVKAYHWYKTGAKIPGYHKFKVSDPAMKTEEEEFTTTDLTIYPDDYTSNTGDWYVTYDVKYEYRYLYDNATGKSAPVLIQQGGKLATAASESTIGNATSVTVSGSDDNLSVTGTITNNMLWYLSRNTDIDIEMGYRYLGESDAQEGAKSKADTEEEYTDEQQGFDPYSVQISNASNSKYFKTNSSGVTIDSEGSMVGTYSGDSGTLSLGDNTEAFTASGYDQRTLRVTNATFMVVKDSLGNLRLMPRFGQKKVVTSLTSGTPTVSAWAASAPANDETGSQTIILQPIQQYQFYVRDVSSSTVIAESAAFYARPGSALASGTIGQATGIPLPDDLIRSYCDYQGAYTTYDATNNTYDNKVTCYPPGAGTGIAVTPIYVPYSVDASLFSTAESPSWYNMSFVSKNNFHMKNATDVLNSGGTQAADESKWQFIGNPYQFKIVSKANTNAGYYLRIPATDGAKADNNGQVNTSTKPVVSNTADNNDWTLVYMVDAQGNVHQQLRTYDKQYTLNSGSDTYYLYVKTGGELLYDNRSSVNNYTAADVFLTNLITVTYHVYKDGSWTTAEYEESIDYEPSQLAELEGLPSSVYRPLCQYTFYKTSAAMQDDQVNGYNNFSGLYSALSDAEKSVNFDVYLSYVVNATDVPLGDNQPVKFFATEEEAAASMEWSFLMQGLESTAKIYGKKLVDYGKARAYGTEDRGDWGEDVEGLTEAEKSFVQFTSYNKIGGFHFLHHNTSPEIDTQTGTMTVPDGISEVGMHKGTRYITSQNTELDVCLMSPLNDFRRIAETYKDGSETSPRTDSWLWAFIGTPYKFEIINREALAGRVYSVDGNATSPENVHYKRLAIIRSGTTLKENPVKLVADYDSQTNGEDDYPHYWTLAQLAPETMPDGTTPDPETPVSFAIKVYGEDYILSHNSGLSLDFKVIPTPAETDISYFKSTGFMAHPWNWSNTKYKTVTVNLYKDNASGTPVLTKTYTPADRAFIAGDVIDGTDGHFYLPVEAQADGSWKPMGVFTNTVPYDKHLINIPYELRRRYCTYSVANGNSTVNTENDAFTIQDTDEEQIINIVYKLAPYPTAPHFVSESDLATFRSKADNAVFKDGAKKKDYYYFLDFGNTLSNHAYVSNGSYYPSGGSDSRYDANDPAQLMYYFVGDPYQLRICNAYTDNVGAHNNLARNVWKDGTHGAYGNNIDKDDKTYMAPESDSRGLFYWEMVDAQTTGSYGYNAASSNVSYRIDYLQDKAFALRTKNKDSENATYYYLGKNSNTSGKYIYKADGETVGASMNQVEAFRNFPDVRHLANVATSTTVTAMRPATVHVSVYDQDEPTRFVTKNELSEYYALTERFTGVPANLQRNYCNYTWASTSSDTKSANMLDGGYFTINDREITMYAKYVETDDSPFSRLDDNGVPVLKRDANLSPWYNMSVGNRWAFFNSNLDGMTSPLYSYNSSAKTWNNLREGTGGKPNNSVLSFPYTGSISTVNDRFHKGMHWALVGDPYNFQIRCQRDIITLDGEGDSRTPKIVNGDYEYTPAYLNGAAIDIKDNATWWTWMRNRMTTNYFLSESPTRRTAVTGGTSAKEGRPFRLPTGYPSDPSANPAANTLNLRAPGESGNIEQGNNYGLGDVMRLVNVDDVDANNEAFDAVVIVYNKVNEPVATTGWTELVRKNVTGNGEIPGDVKRWGCTYHYWADETMTLYPFTSFNQTDDNGNYLIKDGGIVYVTYDYDESLYSSENEYRWVNLFFNWDDITKQWNKVSDNSAVKYKAEYCEYNASTKAIVPNRHTYEVKVNDFETEPDKKACKYTEEELHRETQVGWISSPENHNNTGMESTGKFATSKAWANETSRSESVDQKWAMIGDPYRFILYNYQRKRESDSENAYYLYYDGTNIVNKNFTGADAFNDTDNIKATKQGIYWTWKVDGTKYQFARNNNNATEYYTREEVPTAFYDSDSKLETGYLGICDMTTTSIYDVNNLLGAVKGYASFNHPRLRDVEDASVSSSYTKGYKEKYHIYTDDTNFTDDKTRDYTSWTDITDETERAAALACWQKTYGTDLGYTLGSDNQANVIQSGDYQGYYIGPELELETTVTVNSKKQEWQPTQTMNDDQKYLTVTGGASVKPGGSTVPSLVLGDAERFLVVPMTAQAASVTFHLDTLYYADGKPIAGKTTRNFKANPIFDHTTRNFGVDNTIIMPWMMRRQYCDYKFYVVKDSQGNTPDNANYDKLAPINYSNKIDTLVYNSSMASNAHSIDTRDTEYDTFWNNHVEFDLKTSINVDNDLEVTIPESWKNKHIYLLVRYQPKAEFTAMQSTNTGETDEAKAATIHWVNIQNQEKGNLMRYTRSNDLTAENTDQGENTTNDYLWAIEGDPYGFVLHNRYADHGFDGTANAAWNDKILKTPKVNSTELFNYVSGDDDNNPNFTYDSSGNPVMKSAITYGAKGTADAYGTMSTAANKDHSIYEAMVGNYDDAMIIHPIDGCINIRNQNGYKYSGAFLFNGAPTDFPVQLNYMQEWEAMRNVYCNWQLVKPTAAQILPYYNRAGYVGGLKANVAADKTELFGKLSGGTATDEEFNEAWALVHNPANIVPFQNGHYRLKAYSAGNGLVGGQYVSGYIHKREQENAVPLHIYEQVGASGNLTKLSDYNGNEWAEGFESKIEVIDPEFDPASILYMTRDENGYMKLQTQGLVVKENVMVDDLDEEAATSNEKLFQMQDIGLTAFQIRTKANEDEETNYLSYDPNNMKYGLNNEASELNVSEGISDGLVVKTHDTMWLLEPVGTTSTNAAGTTYQRPLKLKVSALKDGNSYSTFYSPFNFTVPDGVTASTGVIQGEVVQGGLGLYFKGTFTLEPLEDGNVMAGQPVLIKIPSNNVSNNCIELTIPNNAPGTAVENQRIKGTYLTQELPSDILENGDKKVYVLGVSNGKPTFLQNATKDYDNKSNNLFMTHHKMYLVLSNKEAETLSKGLAIDISYLIEEEETTTIDRVNDGGNDGKAAIYDLQGRKVDHIVKPGIYIRNGKKFVVKKGGMK